MSEFLAMGGYAAYVWSAFGFAIVSMAALLLTSIIAARKSAGEFDALKRELRPRRKREKRAMTPKRQSEIEAAPPANGG